MKKSIMKDEVGLMKSMSALPKIMKTTGTTAETNGLGVTCIRRMQKTMETYM